MGRLTVLVALLALGLSSAPGTARRVVVRPAADLVVATAVRYAAPLPVHVLRGFDPPTTKYGAGHLGVDLAADQGADVRAAGDGRVSFAGSVAGRGVVVIAHSDGIRTEYEPVRATVRTGASVRRGQVIGRVTGSHAGCVPKRCLHWGARRGQQYLDPLSLLRALGPVRLLPWTDGGPQAGP